MASKAAVSLKDRYLASMLLIGVGDSIGYRNGQWETNRSGADINRSLHNLCKHGIEKLRVNETFSLTSDDTMMSIGVAEGLLETYAADTTATDEAICTSIAKAFKNKFDQHGNVGYGRGTIILLSGVPKDGSWWNKMEYSPRGTGCGCAMRSAPIGMVFSKENQTDKLISVSILSGRITHASPVGYIGGLMVAAFISYAIRDVPLFSWGSKFIKEVFPKAKDFVKQHFSEEETAACDTFLHHWEKYLSFRKITEGDKGNFVRFEGSFDEKDKLYYEFSGGAWPGRQGFDSVMIAYDSLLHAEDNWIDLMNRSAIHGGDSDSTASIAGALYGIMYGLDRVPPANHQEVHLHDTLIRLGERLYDATSAASKL